jgi:hypothetical protein
MPMRQTPPWLLELLLDSMAIDGAAYVLGAGASMPDVPTLAQLPNAMAPFASHLGSFPASPIAKSALRSLVEPLIQASKSATTLAEWYPGAMTSATIAVLLEHIINIAHWRRLPQYDVFSLLPFDSSIVSFNWDGLAWTRCPQRLILHPHGALRPQFILPSSLGERLNDAQLDDSLYSREWLLPGLVMPGEENAPKHHHMRERVFELWRSAPSVIVIGYSFGLGYTIDYDGVWLDIFSEAMIRNTKAAVHILSPDASRVRAELAERIKRTVNVHAHPLRWDILSRSVISACHAQRLNSIAALRPHAESIAEAYYRIADNEGYAD